MHEVHLVRAVLDTVEKQALAKNAKRVNLVRIRFNPLTSHSGDHVRFSFDLLKKDLPMFKDATLELTEVDDALRCLKCNHQFHGHGHLHGHDLHEICPKCGAVEVAAVCSTDMVLERFEVEG